MFYCTVVLLYYGASLHTVVSRKKLYLLPTRHLVYLKCVVHKNCNTRFQPTVHVSIHRSLPTDLQTRSLTPSELDQLSVLTESSPEGIEFTGSTPQDWRQISLHQYHRGSPSHLFDGGRDKAVTSNKKAWNTGRVWLYQPPSGISSRTK